MPRIHSRWAAALAAYQTPAAPQQPQYDIKRDSRDFAPCAMQVVMRIYNPAPDGSWSGTASVFADVNGSYNASSWGQVSGSSAYPITLSGAVPGSGPISAPT